MTCASSTPAASTIPFARLFSNKDGRFALLILHHATSWVGGLAKGTPPTTLELLGEAALVVAYVALDHLYGIRQALERRDR